ncbi:MAG: HAD-IIB family hydrolase [Lentisphaerae bacterium]|nr:HAD-IIB family hydrolase [Lentisphaerota bacterium]
MADIRLIATDLDGTLIGSVNEFPLYAEFNARINEMRKENGLLWVACTGRNFRSYREFFSPMRVMGVMPDFIIISHAYTYSRTAFGYMPHFLWNVHIRYQMWINELAVRDAINEWYDMITGVALGVVTIRKQHNRLWLRFDSEDSANVVMDLLRERVKPFGHLRVFKYKKEVDVRSVPFTKGLAVSALAKHLNLDREHILAIGNGHNDISMLDGRVAAMVGCPSNSEAEVMRVVHEFGGHIASKRALGGVLEVMDAYAANSVRSELPDAWEDPEKGYNPRAKPSHGHKHHSRWLLFLLIVGVITYMALLAFASLDLIPYVSGLIMKPFNLFFAIVNKIAKIF